MRFPRCRPARALAILALPAAIAISSWGSFGPGGTRVNSVSAAADHDGRAYAAATILESGTSALFRTDDAGRTWTGLLEAGGGDAFSDVFADPRGGSRVFASEQLFEEYRKAVRGLYNAFPPTSVSAIPPRMTGRRLPSAATCGTWAAIEGEA